MEEALDLSFDRLRVMMMMMMMMMMMIYICVCVRVCMYIYIYIYRLFATTVSQLKVCDFSGERFKVFEVL